MNSTFNIATIDLQTSDRASTVGSKRKTGNR